MPLRGEENAHWEVKSIDIDYPGQREEFDSVIRQSSECRGLEVIKDGACGQAK